MLLPFSSAKAVVAEFATPSRLPTKVVAVTEFSPTISVTVLPKEAFVVPIVILLLRSLLLGIFPKSLELVTLPSLMEAVTVHPLLSEPPTP